MILNISIEMNQLNHDFMLIALIMHRKIQLEEQLHTKNQVTKQSQKLKVYSSFIDNTCGANLTDMQLLSRYNKGSHFLICATHVFNKYAWVISLKDKKDEAISKTIQKIVKKLNCKPNKVDKFSIRSMKSWLKGNNIKIYSTHDEGKSVHGEGFIRTLKHEIYKYMTALSKNVFIDT